MRRWHTLGLAAGLAVLPIAALAATFNGRSVDGRWYDGRVVSTTYGAYDCQVRFNGDRAFIRLTSAGITVVGIMDEEAILDPHEIVVNDPKRGVNWSLDCFDLGH